ncbi:hypothetical protein CANCADRAFT_1075 [Tortispora caseinolytica NRRL Y-17796]|uniref:Uncharacterized protein n=1 Tax=Tortispora caseinolytica NRRL Y-17796 TaxID=767744 RepID=A0A1E4TL44_9ASCO|nr:hypothetical protein CANCADRAFT_1075 [Tortispora caseinolytica NRRL Y-17796]
MTKAKKSNIIEALMSLRPVFDDEEVEQLPRLNQGTRLTENEELFTVAALEQSQKSLIHSIVPDARIESCELTNIVPDAMYVSMHVRMEHNIAVQIRYKICVQFNTASSQPFHLEIRAPETEWGLQRKLEAMAIKDNMEAALMLVMKYDKLTFFRTAILRDLYKSHWVHTKGRVNVDHRTFNLVVGKNGNELTIILPCRVRANAKF